MAMSAARKARTPLGVGKIFGESFALLFRHPVKITILGLVPFLAGIGTKRMFMSWAFAREPIDTVDYVYFFVFPLSFIQFVVMFATVSLVALFVASTRHGRRFSIWRKLVPALLASLPMAVLTFATYAVATLTTQFVGLGALVLCIPFLWYLATFLTAVPAASIEGAGFGAFRRSAELTRGYRLPIIGAMIVAGISMFLLFAATILVRTSSLLFLAGTDGFSTGIFFLHTAMEAIGTSLTYGLSGIFVALIYLRLREIKEGGDPEQITSVFD